MAYPTLLLLLPLLIGFGFATVHWRWPMVARLAIFIAPLILLVVWWIGMATNTYLSTNGHRYHLIVASTPAAQAKGLGSRASLPVGEGMLFVFPDEAVRCFWMKDTHFPLDMIWLNAHKQVVHIEANVSPTTYPNAFCPPQVARYVIELNAGQARAAGIEVGQALTF